MGDDGPLRHVAVKIAGASLLNPHAILDTVVVIGSAIAAQRDDVRMFFAGGTSGILAVEFAHSV